MKQTYCPEKNETWRYLFVRESDYEQFSANRASWEKMFMPVGTTKGLADIIAVPKEREAVINDYFGDKVVLEGNKEIFKESCCHEHAKDLDVSEIRTRDGKDIREYVYWDLNNIVPGKEFKYILYWPFDA